MHATCPWMSSSLIWSTKYYSVRSVTHDSPYYALFSCHPLLPSSAQISSAASYSWTISTHILLLILKGFISCFYVVILSYILLTGQEHTPSEANLLTSTVRCMWQQFMSDAKQLCPGMLLRSIHSSATKKCVFSGFLKLCLEWIFKQEQIHLVNDEMEMRWKGMTVLFVVLSQYASGKPE